MINHLILSILLVPDGLIYLQTPRGCHFTKKMNAVLLKMSNLGFRDFRLIFFKECTFFSFNTFALLVVICMS